VCLKITLFGKIVMCFAPAVTEGCVGAEALGSIPQTERRRSFGAHVYQSCGFKCLKFSLLTEQVRLVALSEPLEK
jgi:hypothetical protein